LGTEDATGPVRLLAPIGAGGMAEVWKARDTRLNRVVAIKRFKGHHSGRFKVEGRAIAALNHPHICQVHDVGPDYLVLEYIEGQPLPCPLSVEEAVPLALEIARAIEAAHAKGILHRDLKPANILLTGERSIKLLDFGLAKLSMANYRIRRKQRYSAAARRPRGAVRRRSATLRRARSPAR